MLFKTAKLHLFCIQLLYRIHMAKNDSSFHQQMLEMFIHKEKKQK